jgi:RNA recognition motif-containing protein
VHPLPLFGSDGVDYVADPKAFKQQMTHKTFPRGSMKIYVTNFDEHMEEDLLRSFFRRHGTVRNVHIFRDRTTNRSRGYAVVEMPDDREAEKAIFDLDGEYLDQQHRLRVSEWRSRYRRHD